MKVTMMIGCPYSGKSTYAKKLAQQTGAEIISSDRVRSKLFGNAACQKDPQKVFQICRQDMHKALARGKDVILDSTAMTRKARRSFLHELQKYGSKVTVEAVVCAVPLEVLKKRQEKRARFVPWPVIMKQLKSFEFPVCGEGFDKISIQGTDLPDNYEFLIDVIHRARRIPHDTKWHKESIGDHIHRAFSWCFDSGYGVIVAIAALHHDVGKVFTKEFKDRNGNPTEDAHFYGHAGVGAYLYAAERWQQDIAVEVAQLISYHMIWAYMDKKGLDKIHRLVGDELWKKLEQLHDCDERGREGLESIY